MSLFLPLFRRNATRAWTMMSWLAPGARTVLTTCFISTTSGRSARRGPMPLLTCRMPKGGREVLRRRNGPAGWVKFHCLWGVTTLSITALRVVTACLLHECPDAGRLGRHEGWGTWQPGGRGAGESPELGDAIRWLHVVNYVPTGAHAVVTKHVTRPVCTHVLTRWCPCMTPHDPTCAPHAAVRPSGSPRWTWRLSGLSMTLRLEMRLLPSLPPPR